jgi:hypothetical protein
MTTAVIISTAALNFQLASWKFTICCLNRCYNHSNPSNFFLELFDFFDLTIFEIHDSCSVFYDFQFMGNDDNRLAFFCI